MTTKESRIIGVKYSLTSALIVFLLYEVFLYSQTRGDFANGVLFFIEQQLNFLTIPAYTFYFVSFILLGSMAGFQILIKKVRPFKIAVLYALITTLNAFIPYLVYLIQVLNRGGMFAETNRKLAIQFFLQFLLFAFIFFLGAWLLSVFRISRKNSQQ